MRSRRRDRNSCTPSSMSLQIRETVERLIPDSLPRARTRSSTLRVETPSTPGGADHGVQGLVHPPAGVEQGGEERPGPKLGDGQFHLPGGGGHRLGPRAVAAVGAMRGALVALRADHGGGPEPRPGPAARPGAGGGRHRREQGPGRPGLPGSAWTRQTGSWRASRVHSLVNLGRGTWAPTMPAALPGRRAPSTPRARGNCHHTKRRTPTPLRPGRRDARFTLENDGWTTVVQPHMNGPRRTPPLTR